MQSEIRKTIEGLGHELVNIESDRRGGVLRVYIDNENGVTVADCAAVSEQLGRLLEVEGVDYGRLEVSSPGLDRSLIGERDFARFQGREARIELRAPRVGRKRLQGVLRGVDAGTIRIEVDGTNWDIELANIKRARLIPNV